jgi:hypothetical protein
VLDSLRIWTTKGHEVMRQSKEGRKESKTSGVGPWLHRNQRNALATFAGSGKEIGWPGDVSGGGKRGRRRVV